MSISNNISEGSHPLRMIMTGNCADYKGPVTIEDNKASGFQFYCQNEVTLTRNNAILQDQTVNSPPAPVTGLLVK